MTAQLILAPIITLFGVVPNFILIVVALTAMRNDSLRSTLFGFILGVGFDLCSLGPFGSMTLVLTLLAFGISSLNKGIFDGGLFADMIIMFAALIFGELLVSVIYAIVGVNPEFLLSLVQRVLPGIAYNAVLGFILLLIYNALMGKRTSRRSNTPGRSLGRKLSR